MPLIELANYYTPSFKKANQFTKPMIIETQGDPAYEGAGRRAGISTNRITENKNTKQSR